MLTATNFLRYFVYEWYFFCPVQKVADIKSKLSFMVKKYEFYGENNGIIKVHRASTSDIGKRE